MGQRELTMDLAKLVIAAAWADGGISNEEVNALKDLLFDLEEVSGEDWSVLEMYMESPVTDEEREALLERVLAGIRDEADKTFVLGALARMFRADGEVTAEEQALLDELEGEVSEVRTGVFAGLARAVTSAIGQRKAAVRRTCLREEDWDDYVENTLYYDLQRKQEAAGLSIDRPESERRKLCLATGLLAHVASVDASIAEDEKASVQLILAEDWELSGEEAELFARLCFDRATRGLDFFRLSQSFFECTDRDERRDFIKTLFRVANAANKTDLAEIEEIGRIADHLKVPHKDFIEAKLTISRAERRGL